MNIANINFTDKFQMFDYGPQINKQYYGSYSPPQYDLKKVKVPVAVFYSDNDFVAPPEVKLSFYNFHYLGKNFSKTHNVLF